MQKFIVHSNESTCRKSGRLGLDHVITIQILENGKNAVMTYGHNIKKQQQHKFTWQ